MKKKIISAILAVLMLLSLVACGETAEKTATTAEKTAETETYDVYVDASADKASADGTKAHPFASLGDAADMVASIDRSGREQITVFVASGRYGETVLDERFGGTDTCTVVILAEDGAVISGGISLAPADFVPADGETATYFPEEAKSHIVMIDLKQYGITPDMVESMSFHTQIDATTAASLSVNGERKRLARYPNEGSFLTIRGVNEKELGLSVFNITKDEANRIRSWHSTDNVYAGGWWRWWYRQNTGYLMEVGAKKNTVTVKNIYTDDGIPNEKMVFYFYNIPEELDEAGEYFIDTDAILYYYPEDGFETATVTLPVSVSGTLLTVNASYIKIDGLDVCDARTDAVFADGNGITLANMEISNVRNGIKILGSNNLVTDSDIHDIGMRGIVMTGGDSGKLVRSNSVISNCSVHDFGQLNKCYQQGITLEGCGNTATHCDIYNCPHEAVTLNGPYNTLEYCEIYNCVNEADDIGAVSMTNTYGSYGSAVRYCYIHDIAPLYPEIIAESAPYRCYCSGIYIDGGISGQIITNNIIENVTGDGVIMNGGRDFVCTNNLIINCGTACYSYSQAFWNDMLKGRTPDIPSGFTNNREVWIAAFPIFEKLDFTVYDDISLYNEYSWCTSGGSVVKDNAGYCSSTARHPDGCNFGEKPLKYSDIEMPEITVITDGNFPTVEEALTKYGDLVGVTLDKIGRQ